VKSIEFQWLHDEFSQKEALKKALGCSGQLIKRYLNSKEQDRVVKARDLARLPIDFVNHLHINPEFVGPAPKILTETKDIIAVHKPSGIHCHPLDYNDQNTLLNFLVQKNIWAPLHVNQQNYDRGLLYRLDLETSGLVLLAKNQQTFDDIRENFSVRMKQKLYWAIVDGEFDQEGTWTHYFQASGAKGAKQKVSLDSKPQTQAGTLSVKTLMKNEGKSLVLVQLKSGLRHQIRAQLAALGYPILGDELYGGTKAERLFLHAFRYESQEIFEDTHAELFDRRFDLNRALQMGHDMFRIF
jgi:23S rRNA pseudouridine1911/1915/1917 synthase